MIIYEVQSKVSETVPVLHKGSAASNLHVAGASDN